MDLQSLLLIVPVLLFSVIAHEYAHGYAALKQGDTTALMLGRLTLNPIRHIDPILTILMPVVLYNTTGVALGGAKPVPVNPNNYRHLKRGDIIVSLAGVFTNLILALVCTLLIALIGLLGRFLPDFVSTLAVAQAMCILGIEINLALIAFNLIPIPPLDGSHVMKYLLPPPWAARYAKMGFAGLIVLILVMKFVPGFLDAWFTPASLVQRFLLVQVDSSLIPGVYRWLR